MNRFYEQWLETSQTNLTQFDKKNVPAFNEMLKSYNLILAIQP